MTKTSQKIDLEAVFEGFGGIPAEADRVGPSAILLAPSHSPTRLRGAAPVPCRKYSAPNHLNGYETKSWDY